MPYINEASIGSQKALTIKKFIHPIQIPRIASQFGMRLDDTATKASGLFQNVWEVPNTYHGSEIMPLESDVNVIYRLLVLPPVGFESPNPSAWNY